MSLLQKKVQKIQQTSTAKKRTVVNSDQGKNLQSLIYASPVEFLDFPQIPTPPPEVFTFRQEFYPFDGV